MKNMATNVKDDIKPNCLTNYTKNNSEVIINETMENSSFLNNMNEIKKKSDIFKKLNFISCSKNNTISAEKKRELWRKNSKPRLEKTFMSLEIADNINAINRTNNERKKSNNDYTTSELLNNKNFQSNNKHELLFTLSNEAIYNENKESIEKQYVDNKELFLPDKKNIPLLIKKKDNEKNLNNNSFTSIETGPELKIIDCSPNGKYFQFNEQIGKGSYKNVYKGYDKKSKIYVAWCETNYAHLMSRSIEKVREEIYILSLLSHQNILPLLDYWEYKIKGVKETNIVMITEYFDTGSLKNHIKTLEYVSKNSIKIWGKQILNGLKYLHTHDPVILHRDLKCDNIFYDKRSNIVKIGDLGYTVFKGNFNYETVIGTPEFMAPEMFTENYDEGVDIYAFGMCLLEMVTGEYPYQECHNPNDLFKLISNNIKPLCLNKVKNTYKNIKLIIERCIRNKRNERWDIDEILQDQFFFEYKNYDIKIKALCYDKYLLSDEKILILEVIDNSIKNKKEIADSSKYLSLFTFDCENENCSEVANRLINDFDIDIKLKDQLIIQLEKYVKITKIRQKYRKIEKENELLSDDIKIRNNNMYTMNTKIQNYGFEIYRVISMVSPTFLEVLKECKINYKFDNDKNAQLIIVKTITTIDTNDKIFYTLFIYKKQQALIITTVKSFIPERIVKSLVNINVISENVGSKIVLILKAVITKIEKLLLKYLPIKMRFSFEDSSIKSEQVKYIKINKNKINRKMFSLESTNEINLLQKSLIVSTPKQWKHKKIYKNWNILTEGKLCLSINELEKKIFEEDGNFSLEKSTISALFENFTPNLFSSTSYCIQFDKDNISHHITANDYETFFNVFNNDFNKFIQECHFLNALTVIDIENKINEYYTCIKLTQKRSLTMKKSKTFSEPSMQNNNNIQKTPKKAAPKHFQISKVCLEENVIEKNLKINLRKRSTTVCTPITIDISKQLEVANDRSLTSKILNDKKVSSSNDDSNYEENLDNFDELFSTFETRKKSFINKNMYKIKKIKDNLVNASDGAIDGNIFINSKNKPEISIKETSNNSPTIINLNCIESENKNNSLNISNTAKDKEKNSKIFIIDEKKPENNIVTSHVIINDEPKEHTFSVIKLQKNSPITNDFKDESFYEEKYTIAKNKKLYKANSLKNDCNFVDDVSIVEKKKVAEISKKLAELLNNEDEMKNNPTSNNIEGNIFNNEKKLY